ncbi:MAG TPA: hypothetical protein VFA34_08660 [Actinomycetota bacterium]|nr:hypothetical protein [Actinomycetota bacterium]
MRMLTRVYSAALSACLGFFFIFPAFPTALPRDANIPAEAWWSFLGRGLPAPPPTTVPADALGVGHLGAQQDKVAAIGITLQAEEGSLLEKLVLTLTEAEGVGANIGSDAANVVACPITGPWEPVLNGNWADVPSYDCTLAKVAGKRNAAGAWTFDLAPMGQQWLDAEFPLEQAGVILLIEEASAPTQVSFAAIKTGRFRLEFSAVAPADSEPAEPVVVGGLEAPDSPAPEPAAPAPTTNDAEPAVLLTQPAQNKTGGVAEPDILGNLPWGTWLLVPLALGGAAAVSYALGGGARRGTGGRRRAGAVSRALSKSAQDRMPRSGPLERMPRSGPLER